MPDYLTDARLGKVAFMKMKKFLEEKGAPKSDLFVTSTKFALVAVAERHNIKLEPLLDELGPKAEAAKAAAEAEVESFVSWALMTYGPPKPARESTAATPVGVIQENLVKVGTAHESVANGGSRVDGGS